MAHVIPKSLRGSTRRSSSSGRRLAEAEAALTASQNPDGPLRELTVLGSSHDSVEFSVRLPARGMGLAVVVRSKKAYAEMRKKHMTAQQAVNKAQMDFQRNNIGKMADASARSKHQMNVMMPLQRKVTELWVEYGEDAKKMFGALAGQVPGDWVCAHGALEIVSGAKKTTTAEEDEVGEAGGPQFTPFTLYKPDSLTTAISMVNDSGIVRFKINGLWANTCFEVAVYPVVKVQGEEVETMNQGKGAIAGPVRVWTTASDWQRALEKHGLSNLIAPFQELGLTKPGEWVAIVESPATSAAKDLDIDPVTLEALKEIISESGFVTKEEQKQLDADRIEIEGTAKNMIQAFVNNTMSLGDPVRLAKRKTAAQARRKTITAVISAATSQGVDPDFGVIVAEEGDSFKVKWGVGLREVAPVLVKGEILKPHKFAAFLSHAQHEAQFQCGLLALSLRQAKYSIWYDQDAERLEARDMVRGVAHSDVFVLYLSKSYFTRYFCRLEATTAMQLGKQVLVIYESDERAGGNANFITLAKQATAKYPEFYDWVTGTEAIPMVRRAYARRAMVEEIAKRLSRGGAKPVGGGGAVRASGAEAGVTAPMKSKTPPSMQMDRLTVEVQDLQAELLEVRGQNHRMMEMIDELRDELRSV